MSFLPLLLSPVRSIGSMDDAVRQHAPVQTDVRRCLSYPRSRPGCESSLRWSRRLPIERAGPAHVATLKTIDPPLSTLDGRRLAGAERRAKNLLFPLEDGELVLRVHLMSAGRIRYLKPGAKGPKRPMFRLGFSGGGELILTEGGKKKRAGVWLTTPDRLEADLAHLGPDALDVDASALGEILNRERRQLHPLLRDQRALAGIGTRARERDPPPRAAKPVQGLDGASRRRRPRGLPARSTRISSARSSCGCAGRATRTSI